MRTRGWTLLLSVLLAGCSDGHASSPSTSTPVLESWVYFQPKTQAVLVQWVRLGSKLDQVIYQVAKPEGTAGVVTPSTTHYTGTLAADGTVQLVGDDPPGATVYGTVQGSRLTLVLVTADDINQSFTFQRSGPQAYQADVHMLERDH